MTDYYEHEPFRHLVWILFYKAVKELYRRMVDKLISIQVLNTSLGLYCLVGFFTGNWTASTNGISPIRWLASLALPMLLASKQLKLRAITRSGALAIVQVGFLLTLANYSFFTAFATHIYLNEPGKRTVKVQEPKSWMTINAEMLLGLYVALIHILEYGVGGNATTFDFREDYLHTWLSVMFMGTLSVSIGASFWSTAVKSAYKGTAVGLGFYLGHFLSGNVDDAIFRMVTFGLIGGLFGSVCCTVINGLIWKDLVKERRTNFGLQILSSVVAGILLPRFLLVIEANLQDLRI